MVETRRGGSCEGTSWGHGAVEVQGSRDPARGPGNGGATGVAVDGFEGGRTSHTTHA